jgi:hypothetical protein
MTFISRDVDSLQIKVDILSTPKVMETPRLMPLLLVIGPLIQTDVISEVNGLLDKLWNE